MRIGFVAVGAAFLLTSVAGVVAWPAAAIQSQARDSVAVELLLPGLISTPLDELNAAFSPDGREVYWAINSAQSSGMGVIVVSRLRGDRWTPPEVASFSGQYSDYDPFIAPDGQKLYFISNRPKGSSRWDTGDFDVYVVDRQGNGWSAPRNLGGPVNSERPEYYPSIASDGTMYISTIRPGSRSFDIFRSRQINGAFQALENLGDSVSGTANTAEIDNYIAPDQSYLIFAAGRPGGIGGQDLWVSFNRNGTWSTAQPLPQPINSESREYTPIGSPDGRWLYFTSMRGFQHTLTRPLTMQEWRDSIGSVRNGNGNVYRVPIEAILRLNRP